MNKIEKMLLVIGISVVAAFPILYLVNDWTLGSAGIIAVFLISLLLIDPLDSKAEKAKKKKAEEDETFESDVRATVDSRTYERPSYFLGLPIFIVFGGISSKYESVFSVEHEGKTIPVLYHGLCLISKEDRLRIQGEWYCGKKLGVWGYVVIAGKIENLSSGLVFAVS